MPRPMHSTQAVEKLTELIASDAVMITPKDAGVVLGVHQSYITDDARLNRLPFPAYVSGNRVKIPRAAFLKWGGWLEEEST